MNRREHPAIDDLLVFAGEVLPEDTGKARILYSAVLEKARRLRSTETVGKAQFGLGECFRTEEKYNPALRRYSWAMEAFRASGNRILQGRCLRRLGDVHYYVTNYSKAMEYYLRALRVFQSQRGSSESRVQAGHLLATVGNVLRATGDLGTALEYYRRCHDVYVREGFQEGIPGILYNRGNVYFDRGDMGHARNCFESALAAADESGEDYLASLALTSLGSIFLAAGELEQARIHLSRSLEISERIGRKMGKFSVLLKQTELERLSGNLEAALSCSLQAGILAIQLEERSGLRDILKERTLILRELGEFEKALHSSIICRELGEELRSRKRMRELDVLRLRYETEERESQIALLQDERSLQRRITFFSLTGLAVAAVSILSLYRNVRYRIRTGTELEKKNRQLSGAFARVEKLSRTDMLTGLWNRRAMMEALEMELSRSRRSQNSWALIMGDIDGFKQVNDRYGHACGDQVLMMLADLFRKVLRRQDTPSRWGGEEFLILLPDSSSNGALKVAEKLRRAVESTSLNWNGRTVRVTMTFGVSSAHGGSLDRTIQKADEALYRGKEAGRNRVSL